MNSSVSQWVSSSPLNTEGWDRSSIILEFHYVGRTVSVNNIIQSLQHKGERKSHLKASLLLYTLYLFVFIKAATLFKTQKNVSPRASRKRNTRQMRKTTRCITWNTQNCTIEMFLKMIQYVNFVSVEVIQLLFISFGNFPE